LWFSRFNPTIIISDFYLNPEVQKGEREMAKVSAPIFKPGQPVAKATATNTAHTNVVAVAQVAPFVTSGDPNLYCVLKADNTMVYLTEAQIQAK